MIVDSKNNASNETCTIFKILLYSKHETMKVLNTADYFLLIIAAKLIFRKSTLQLSNQYLLLKSLLHNLTPLRLNNWDLIK